MRRRDDIRGHRERSDTGVVRGESDYSRSAADVDIADWLFHLPDAEYQRCAPPDQKAAGSTTTDDGRLMTINVEEIGGTLLIQHYVAETYGPHHCRMVSLTDVRTPDGWTRIQVIWDLSVVEETLTTCAFTNLVISYPTQEFLDLLAASGTQFEDAAALRQSATVDHNERETTQYAASIGCAAQSRHRPRFGSAANERRATAQPGTSYG